SNKTREDIGPKTFVTARFALQARLGIGFEKGRVTPDETCHRRSRQNGDIRTPARSVRERPGCDGVVGSARDGRTPSPAAAATCSRAARPGTAAPDEIFRRARLHRDRHRRRDDGPSLKRLVGPAGLEPATSWFVLAASTNSRFATSCY